jgi:hypothetical protein
MLLAAGLIAAAILLLSLTSKLTFIADEWNLILLRQGWGPSQFIEPFNGHPIMAPAFVFKALQEIFGMDSPRPMQVAATGTFLVMNVLLFIYLRRRLGGWCALIGTFLILFLGAAFEDLLFAFQIGYFGSLAAGVAALLCLDRDDHRGDIGASILLVVSLLFSSVGIAFVAAAVAEWAMNPRRRRERLFVPGIAALLYLLWWLGWGHVTSENSLDPGFQLSVLPKVPEFMFNAFSAGLVSIAGIATGDGSEPDQPHLIWGQIGTVVFIGLAIWRCRRMKQIPRSLVAAAAGGLCLLFLFALAQDAYISYGAQEARPPTASRYQLTIAVFIVLVAADLLRGLSIKTWMVGVAGVLAAFAISGGIQLMTDKAYERWEPAAAYTRSTLFGIEAAAPDYRPEYTFRPGTSFDVPIGDYRSAIDQFGSPAYSEQEMLAMDQPFRASADSALIDASGIALNGSPPAYAPRTCRTVTVGESLEVKPGSMVVVNLGASDLGVNLARVGDQPGLPIGSVLGGTAAGLDLPAGSLDIPWTVSVTGEGPGRVCRARQ